MVDVFLKNKQMVRVENLEQVIVQQADFYIIQLMGYCQEELDFLERHYKIDTSILKGYKDIEISSHFLFNAHQVAFHISIPFYNSKKELEERSMFFIITREKLFVFLDEEIDAYFNRIYNNKMAHLQHIEGIEDLLRMQIEFISDYYADITEGEAKQIKLLANQVLLKQNSSGQTTNLITKYVFNNMLIKEMLLETTRVFTMYKKNEWLKTINVQTAIEQELNDLSVVSDYIEFNLERLSNLKENISNKIEIEQNHIFKTLTVITICVSLPTLVAGIYGMNFDYMPELREPYAYPAVLLVMLLSAIFPYLYFRRRKWM